MRSASPLIKNDPRVPAIVERLKRGANLNAISKELGYANNHSLRHVLRDLIGNVAYAEIMVGRAGRQTKAR